MATESVGRVAYATGGAIILAMILLGIFFAVGEPFGTLNDTFNGISGILCGVLAWMLYSQHHAKSPSMSQMALAFALVGALIVAISAILIIFKFTGWVLAGWYSVTGYAFIGIWLSMFCYAMLNDLVLPRKLTVFGLIVGLLMVVGLPTVFGILNKVDSMDALPMILNISFVSYLGDLLFPVWCLWLARVLVGK